MSQIYLDNNATTLLDPRVRELTHELSRATLGNPSNRLHDYGRRAGELLDEARARIQRALGAEAYQVVFVSSATEGLNLVIQGWTGKRIIVSSTEHKSVSESVRWMARNSSYETSTIPVSRSGIVDLDFIRAALGARSVPTLVATQTANSETGVVQPIDEVLALVENYPVLTLVDATQALGKVRLDLSKTSPDFVVLSSHKIYGPAGVGVVLIRKDSAEGRIRPALLGGGQESGIRSGTENVLGVCGFGLAVELAVAEQAQFFDAAIELRNLVEKCLERFVEAVGINGLEACRLPNTTSFSLEKATLDDCLRSLDRLAISAGSACNSRDSGPSRTLVSMGRSVHQASNALRLSFGRFNTLSDAEVAVEQLEAFFDPTERTGDVDGR